MQPSEEDAQMSAQPALESPANAPEMEIDHDNSQPTNPSAEKCYLKPNYNT